MTNELSYRAVFSLYIWASHCFASMFQSSNGYVVAFRDDRIADRGRADQITQLSGGYTSGGLSPIFVKPSRKLTATKYFKLRN